jgi:hypothetical protein
LKKNWVCPSLFQNKTTQSKFKEFWDSRTDFVIQSMAANEYIKDDAILSYVGDIVKDIAKTNPDYIKGLPSLLIDRNEKVNAYSVGNNLIIINAGMIAFCQSREELALAIAHELAHEYLQHSVNSMKESATLVTSENYKKSLESILDSEYERLTKLKKVMTSYSFNRNRHNRYHENEADSLAITMLKNSKIGFDPSFFLRLDSADIQYTVELTQPVSQYLASYNLVLDDGWFVKKNKGLSTRAYNFKDTSINKDSLKTHPDCTERYLFNKNKKTVNSQLTPIPASIREKATKILLWDMFNNMQLTQCLYRIFQIKEANGPNDPWYDFMVYNIFSGLNYSNARLNRFNAIGVKTKEEVSKSYYQLQTMLEQIPAERLQELSEQLSNQPFWSKLPADCRQFKNLLSDVKSNETDPGKKISKPAKEFIDAHSSSIYCEFAELFK